MYPRTGGSWPPQSFSIIAKGRKNEVHNVSGILGPPDGDWRESRTKPGHGVPPIRGDLAIPRRQENGAIDP